MGSRLLALGLLLVLSGTRAWAADVTFEEVGVTLSQPEGFQVAGDWDGFGQRSTGASILAMRIEAPYEAVVEGFVAETLAARGWTFLSREAVDLAGQAAVLVHFSQPHQGKTYLKWSLITGDSRSSILVTGTVPEIHAATVSGPLKAAVLSARIVSSDQAPERLTAGVKVTPGSALVETPGVSGTLLFTKDGVVPTVSPSDPLFIVAPSMGSTEISDPRAFAEQRLYQTAHTEVETIRSTSAITIDGLEGFETLATAFDERSRTPLLLYQVFLVDGRSYVLIQGLVGRELESTYVPVFRAAARSLVRSQ